jgi:hypothetical protein
MLRDEVIPRVASLGTVLFSTPLLIPWHDDITWRLERLLNQLVDFYSRLGGLLTIGRLPFRLWDNAEAWTRIRGEASDVTGDLGVTNRDVHVRWKGAAAEAYDAIIPAHMAAATRLATVADTVQTALTWAAVVGAVFYSGVLAVTLQTLAALGTAVAMARSVPTAVVGLVLALTAVAGVTVQLSTMVVVAAEAFSRLQIFLSDMLSEMVDNSAFPHGTWPASREELYADATVTDGDAEWSVAR